MADDEKRTNGTNADTVSHYTRTGDDGTTALGDIGPVGKDDNRLAVYADCGEANAAIGVALALAGGLPVHVVTALSSVQHDLFDLVTGIGHPGADGPESQPAHITTTHIERLEHLCDHYSTDLSLVDDYVLPGGTVTSALLFQAWSVTRRAERTAWAALGTYPDELSPLTARYLNRLANLLFILARAANAELGDVMWYPMASVTAVATGKPAAGDSTQDNSVRDSA